MSEPTKGPRAPLPPYIAFKTLTDLIERMEREDPPTRVDPTYLDSYAGGYRPTVIGNLQTLGLLNDSREPTERMLALVRAPEGDRQHLVGELIKGYYGDVLALGRNATQGQLLEAFNDKNVSGETRRKAIGFFINACKYADIGLSPHWKTPAAAKPLGARKKGANTTDNNTGADAAQTSTKNSQGAGETVVVDLGPAGAVTINVNVAWLVLNDKSVTALREGIKILSSLPKLAADNKPPEPNGSDDDHDEGNDQ